MSDTGARPRVLILSQYFWPESFRINEVAESLKVAGCDVCVLTGQPNYPDGRVFKGFRAFAWGMTTHPSGIDVFRVPLVPRGQRSAVRLGLNYLSFVVAGAIMGPWLLRRRRIDVTFVYGISPILQSMVGIVLQRTHGARLVTWVQDLWPQSLEVTGYLRNQRALRAIAGIVRWIYRRSDLLLVQSEAFLPTVRAMAGGTPVEFCPNPGERAFESATAPAEPAPFPLDGFSIVFAGNLGNAQALQTIVDAAARLHGVPGVRFVLVGSGVRSTWLEQQVRERGLTNLSLPGRFPPEAMPAIFGRAAALLVTLARSEIMGQTIPSKVQAYLAAGRPIIACLDGEGARVVREAGAGVACAAEDDAALAEAVLDLRACSPERLAAMGRSGREYYERHYHPDTLARALRTRFLELSGSDRARRPGEPGQPTGSTR
jgi:glycosyltransferase involved in cell wall biosynthesis